MIIFLRMLEVEVKKKEHNAYQDRFFFINPPAEWAKPA
jgi:hypothetical protein